MQTVYSAKEGKTIWVILISLAIANLVLIDSDFQFLPYVLLAVFFVALFMKYRLTVSARTVTFEIHIFGVNVLKRVIEATKIKSAYFMKMGRGHTVLFLMKRGIRLKLTRFSPDSFHEDLYRFAQRHEIPIHSVGFYEPPNEENERESEMTSKP
ncbi:hypothetical protein [Halalkalibacterium ligniniphilum]|uniref:hypothetical protein n=1 Tax=Halalkalibacterium ligniniphilum TaxID=1134413 RepID=UPI0003471B29|nr:hypothetical protein [Halalkalibacterium ligniniphilum]